MCDIRPKENVARFTIGIDMADREALNELVPCFDAEVRSIGKGMFRIKKHGKKALGILNRMDRTSIRKEKDENALRKCKEKWKEGYYDSIP